MFDLPSLTALFAPRSIALVGASSSPRKTGGIPIAYQLQHGFRGAFYAINPNATEIQGVQAHPSLRAIGAPVDLAIFAVPSAMVASALDDAIAAGARSIVLFSAGYAEIDDHGRREQERLASRARQAGIRILGPNCLGVINVAQSVYATFSPAPAAGRVASGSIGLVSQSGAFGTHAYSLARSRGLGLSYWVTTGNEADIDFSDCLAWLANDPGTRVIMGYMEGCRDGEKLKQALTLAHQSGKPVVLVKVGKTALGAAAAQSHTAALAGDDAVFDSLFRQYGVYRADSIEEFFQVGYGLATAGVPRNGRIGLLSVSGGVGALMADQAAMADLEVTELPVSAQARIRELSPLAAPRNPVDVTGLVLNDSNLLKKTAEVMLDQGGYGSLLGFMAAGGLSDMFWPMLQDFAESTRARFPDTVLALSTLITDERRRVLERTGCMVFEEPADAIRVIAALNFFARARTREIPQPGVDADTVQVAPGALNEFEALRSLTQAGIPAVTTRVARSADEAEAIARNLNLPLAIKVLSPDITHKSDVGGVRLGVATPQEARQAFELVLRNARAAAPKARIDGVLMAPMVRGGVECILGARCDPVLGPVVMFGLGGILVEVLRDVSIRIAPFDRVVALEMIREVRGYPVLQGVRGRPPADIDALADALVALSTFAFAARDTLDSVELNPFVALPPGEGALALDAVLIGRAA